MHNGGEEEDQIRVIMGLSGLLVAFSLIVMSHCAIVNKHMRDLEVTNALSSAIDYATDMMQDMCADISFEMMDKTEAKRKLIQTFCKTLEAAIGTDGEIKVYVLDADIETGNFDFIIEETYKYTFKGRKGVARCERVVRFDTGV
ncbi:MAG: hypothetical protein Q4F11_07910 [Eubacteriales bacterium]|nr:hypothetical protein [Eubacteriales bacterium]